MMHTKNDITTFLKKIFFAGFVLLLCIPVGFKLWKPNYFGELKGYFVPAENPELTSQSWFNGTFQTEKEKWAKENNGLYVGSVRLKNQFIFDVNHRAKTYWVEVGKEDYLFEIMYIDAYTGHDFVGDEKINTQVQKLKMVQDTLQKMGITLLSVLAPGKGSFYAEYIPDKFLKGKKQPTNYAAFVREMAKNKINTVDFNKSFLAQKDESPYPLFPKTGIHWSAYGEFVALDSLLKNMAAVHQIAVPQLEIISTEITYTPRGRDQDIEDGMNLLYDIPDLEMAYIAYKYVRDENKTYPKVLVIADSYYYQLYNHLTSANAFNHGDFWYYNKQVFPPRDGQIKNVSDLDLYSELTKNKAIVILATDANLRDFGFGFIENAYQLFYPEK